MSTKALFIFNNAMALMDEFSTTKVDGRYVPNANDTEEYKARTLPTLNILGGELYPYSDTYIPGEDGKRPIFPVVDDIEADVELDDYICRTVLPYGLAANLLLQEDPAVANFFQQRYDELRGNLQRGMPAVSVDMEDVYCNNINGDPIGFAGGGRW